MIATVRTAKNHFTTDDNVYPACHQTDGTLPQNLACLAHRLCGQQHRLQDEIKLWFSFIRNYFLNLIKLII